MSKEISTDVSAEQQSMLPVEYQEQQLLDAFKKVEEEVKSEVTDFTTEEGRKRIKKLAADVSKSKTAIDTRMRDYLRKLKSSVKPVEKNARESVERFDKLRDDLLAPVLAAYEPQKQLIEMMERVPSQLLNESLSVAMVNDLAAQVQSVDVDTIWPEHQKKARTLKEAALTLLADALKRLEAEEARNAELESLRKAKEESEQRERDRMVSEAARKEAERLAEEKARRDQEDANRRAAESKAREEQAVLAQKQAEEKIKAAEAQRLVDEEQRAKREEQQRLAAEEAQRVAVAAAEAAERDRMEAQKRAEQEEAEKRAADKAHRSAINRDVLAALLSSSDFDAAVKSGDPTEVAKAVITLAARRNCGRMVVNY
ncbi:hypothetical protein [Erwinia phage Gungnir39]|nr:hypothetical protein [Erwinia phage Gungnir39]